ncbi:DUF4236 domain-containing protein [Cyanobium sp. NIES-981]|uniref:DUF4236 domain-containing protein n=1 Tax=Cyanobium sp. NIES-981 TaxID=1851505 RepID=UPI0007DCCFFD|nr:DUF4236 domain-containing protein [Cyanobium sp. NIES-981]SBO42660.1 conserved protein of unknown function [Cyanobium sp. NIES-981]
MTFRFRRSARLGPLRFNFARSGLSSISIGGPGASLNVPVGRSGTPRTTVGLPGTGLSWSLEHPAGPAAGLPNSRRLRPGQLERLRLSLLQTLQQELFGPGRPGERLWREGRLSRLLADDRLSPAAAGLLAVIETPEAMEAYLLRSRSQDDARRRAQRCIQAVEEAWRLAGVP